MVNFMYVYFYHNKKKTHKMMPTISQELIHTYEHIWMSACKESGKERRLASYGLIMSWFDLKTKKKN